jgi:hypothetical protein
MLHNTKIMQLNQRLQKKEIRWKTHRIDYNIGAWKWMKYQNKVTVATQRYIWSLQVT